MVLYGSLSSLTPTTIEPGKQIRLRALFHVGTTSWWEWHTGWEADIKISLNGMTGKVRTPYIYDYQKDFSYLIDIGPGVMPDYDLSGDVTITCYKGFLSGGQEIVFYEPILIKTPIPDGDGNDDDGFPGEFPIVPVAIAAGVGIVALAAIMKKKK